MQKQISPKIVSLTFGVMIILFALGFYIFAWTEPTQAPPSGNVSAPLNVGNVGQSKQGGLILNTGGAEYGLIVDKGKVGIWTTTPDYALSVIGDIFASGEIIGKMTKLTKDFVVAPGQTISQGDVVSLVNGQIRKGFGPGLFVSFGEEYSFDSRYAGTFDLVALDSSRFIVFYKMTTPLPSYSCGARLVTVTGLNNLSFGPEYIFTPIYCGSVGGIKTVLLDSQRVLLVFQRGDANYYYLNFSIVTISGSSISFGSSVEMMSNTDDDFDFDVVRIDPNRFLVVYLNSYGPSGARLGTVSGSTITLGPSTTLSNSYQDPRIALLDSTHFVIAYTHYPPPAYTLKAEARIGTISGSNISFGSEYPFNLDAESTRPWTPPIPLDSNRFVVIYDETLPGPIYRGAALVGTVSGSTISFGSESVFVSGEGLPSALRLDQNRFLVLYRESGSEFGIPWIISSRIGTVSGSTISFGKKFIFKGGSAYPYLFSDILLTPTRFVFGYTTNSAYGQGIFYIALGEVSNDGLIGIAKQGGTAGQTIPVIIGGISNLYSGLTPGTIYYANDDGSLTTAQTPFRVGLAISSTEILLNQQW